MFGYIRVNKPECRVREYEYYRGVYCGLCHALGKCTGQCSRLMLGYDFTFMALVRLAMAGATPTFKRSACIAHPFRRRPMAKPERGSEAEEIFSLCACATALLSYHKVMDDVTDEKGLRRMRAMCLRPLMAGPRKRARKRYEELESSICRGLLALSEIEKSDCSSMDAPAEAFGRLLSDVFSYGLADGQKRIAAEIGFRVGKWIYLVDAADDYEEDIKKGRYNPLARAYGESLTADERESLAEALIYELRQAERGFDLIDYPDANSRGVVENIIYAGMPSVAKHVLTPCSNGKEKKNDGSL